MVADLSEPRVDLGKTGIDGRTFEPKGIIHSGIAGDGAVRLDVRGNARLGGGNDVVADRQVAGNAHLAGKDHVAAELAAPRQACLPAEQGVLPDVAGVAHLHEIVNLGPAPQAGFSYRSSIHAGIGLHLHGVLDDHGSRLHNLVVRAVRLPGESEAIASHHHAVLEDDVIANPHVLTDHRMRVREEAVADLGASIDHDEALQYAVIAQFGSFFNDHVRANREIPSQLDIRGNHRRRMNTRRRATRRGKDLQGLGKGQVGVLRTENRPIYYLDIRGHDDGRGVRRLQLAVVLRVGKKSQLGR